jgi:dTDP-L-rhamnose 4-epimerase
MEDGRQLRDFVHVSDVARANVTALESRRAGAFNVASGEPATVAEMATALCDAFGARRPEIVGGYRLGDVRHVFASIERARTDLAFKPRVGLATGMREFARAPLRAPAIARGNGASLPTIVTGSR